MATEFVTDLTSTEKARKYNYVFNALTRTWVDNDFALSNLRRETGRVLPGGRQAIIPLETAPSGSFRFSNPGESPAEAGTAAYDEAIIDYTTLSTSVEYDWHAKLAGQTDKLSFIQLRTKAVTDAVEVIGLRASHAVFMPKSNQVARLKTDLGGNKWQLYKETESGANGTAGARFLFKNGYLGASANLTGTTCEKTFDGYSKSVDRVLDQVVLAGTIGDVAADDYLYWGTKDRSSKGRGMTGLPTIVNDGTDYAVFEGRDRTVAGNEDWQATVSRNFGSGNIEIEIINQAINLDKKINKRTNVVWYGLKTQRLHFQQMLVDRRAMVPVGDVGSGPTFHGGFKALPVAYGDQNIAAMANREIPDDKMWGLHWEDLFMGVLSDFVWIDEGEGQFKHVPDTFSWKAHLAGVMQIGSRLPSSSWVTTGITP